MELYLIRHTTPGIAKGICYGQSDIPLANTFDTEAKAVLKQLETLSFDAVYSSPLLRCKQLALKISPNVIEDPRLMELNFGNWELKKWDNIPRKESEPWMQDFVRVSTPNGESYINLQKRAISFYNEIKDQPYSSIAIVTHAGFIRALVSYINTIDLKDSFDLKVPYGVVMGIR